MNKILAERAVASACEDMSVFEHLDAVTDMIWTDVAGEVSLEQVTAP